jgi:trehalose 6-phosphate synthase/phosphatase
VWIGWPGIFTDSKKEQAEIKAVLKKWDCIPVFFDEETINKFFGYYESVIRPIFHNFKDLNEMENESELDMWQGYLDVNEKIAERACQQSNRDNDLFWLHDAHLMMVPKLIKRHNIEATIGIFMHSPFPSSDVYKMLPKRIEVLSALTCCDLIGFHLFEHARHFFTACRRVLGLNHEFKKGGFL